MKKNRYLYVFGFAFLLNLIWENLHAQLYVHYMNGPITEWVLLKATFVDATIITTLYFLSQFLKEKYRTMFLIAFGICVALGIEWFALSTNRWEYKPSMPIIPVVRTGLTPTIQLSLLGVISVTVASRLTRKKI